MAAKCDVNLTWWIRLANLHRQEVPSVADPISGNKGFADKVRRLEGPRPEAIEVLLNPTGPLQDRLLGFGNDPDKCLWGLAGVAKSILSSLSELRESRDLPHEIVIADWSNFTAPLILAVAASGQIEKAFRPEPLANELLSLLRRKTVETIGTCPVCQLLFQPLRRDQKCDTSRCRDTYRQRRQRGKAKEYEANRRRYRRAGIRAKALK